MSDLNEVGERDNWICWLCDKPVDPDASVNSDLGPSTDSYAAAKAKKGSATVERLAHRACNTMKGKIAPVVPWIKDVVVADPSPIFESVERLKLKGGREVVARCMDSADAEKVAEWLVDRLGRLAPETKFSVDIKPGGGQFMLSLRAD
jgi:hypothetical protein